MNTKKAIGFMENEEIGAMNKMEKMINEEIGAMNKMEKMIKEGQTIIKELTDTLLFVAKKWDLKDK